MYGNVRHNPLVNRARPEPARIDSTPIEGRLRNLQPLEFELVRRTGKEPLLNSLLEEHHYLGYEQPVGNLQILPHYQQLTLVRARQRRVSAQYSCGPPLSRELTREKHERLFVVVRPSLAAPSQADFLCRLPRILFSASLDGDAYSREKESECRSQPNASDKRPGSAGTS